MFILLKVSLWTTDVTKYYALRMSVIKRQYETTSTNECKSWIYRVNCRCFKKTETDLPHTFNEGRYEQDNIYWNGCPLF